jgi:hypothetical protein
MCDNVITDSTQPYSIQLQYQVVPGRYKVQLNYCIRLTVNRSSYQEFINGVRVLLPYCTVSPGKFALCDITIDEHFISNNRQRFTCFYLIKVRHWMRFFERSFPVRGGVLVSCDSHVVSAGSELLQHSSIGTTLHV